MSTHNIPFSILKKKITELSQISSYEIFSQGPQERVRNSGCERAIGVRATEVLL